MKKYLLAGSTSDLGNRVAQGLSACLKPEQITCLVRATSDPNSIACLKGLGVKVEVGDVTDGDTLSRLLDCDTIYIDMTHPKYYHKSIDIVKRAGVKRAFFITTTGIFSSYNQCSDIYKEGEARIKKSGIKYTIIRPSMIYGTGRDRNMTKLLKFLSKYPLFPVFGDGNALMQPVYVQDLADGIIKAIIEQELSSGKEYNLCGPNALSFEKLVRIASGAVGNKVRVIHIPHGLATALVGVAEKLPGFPVNKEQVMRLVEDKAFDIYLAQQELDYSPREYAEGIKEEVACLREMGLLK